MKVDSYILIGDHSVINICMHEYIGDTRGVVLDMLYHNVIMHGVCNSQLNVKQSKPYYTSNHLTFYFNL